MQNDWVTGRRTTSEKRAEARRRVREFMQMLRRGEEITVNDLHFFWRRFRIEQGKPSILRMPFDHIRIGGRFGSIILTQGYDELASRLVDNVERLLDDENLSPNDVHQLRRDVAGLVYRLKPHLRSSPRRLSQFASV